MRNTTLAVVLTCAPVLAQGMPFDEARAIEGKRLFPRAVASVDLDLDGYRDILMSNGLALDTIGPFEAIVLDEKQRARSTRNAKPTGELGLVMQPVLLSGRFDGDELEDIVTISDNGFVATYANKGPGPSSNPSPLFDKPAVLRRLETMRSQTSGLVRARFYRAMVVDVDGDGIDEVAVSYHVVAFLETLDRSGLILLRNLGDKSKYNESAVLFGDIRDFTAGDFDGDGDVDFVGLDENNELSFAWNRGRGNAWARSKEPPIQPSSPTMVRAIDLDGDGVDELALAASTTRSAELWVHNRYSDTERRTQLKLAPPPLAQVDWMQAADLDGDDDLDLVCLLTAFNANARVVVLLQQPSGAFQKAGEVQLEAAIYRDKYPSFPCGAVLADFDRDGDLDVMLGGAVHRKTSKLSAWFLPNKTQRGRGARRIEAGTTYTGVRRPTLSFGPDAKLGNRHFSVRLGNVPAGQRAALLLDWRRLRLQAGGITLIAGLWRSFGTETYGDPENGFASLSFDVPNDKELLNFTFRFQWLVRHPKAQNPFGVLASDGWSLQLVR